MKIELSTKGLSVSISPRTNMLRVLLVMVCLMLALGRSSAATFTAYNYDQDLDVTGAPYAWYVPETLGLAFRPNESIAVTSLGFFDLNRNGLTGPREVGIFAQSSQALIAFALVNSDDPLSGDYRYKAITAVTLQAGETYFIAGHMPNTDIPNTDDDLDDQITPYSFTNQAAHDPSFESSGLFDALSVNGKLQYLGADWKQYVTQLTYPDDNVVTYSELELNLYIPIANFQFQTLNAATVPEPGTMMIWMVAGGVLVWHRRRAGLGGK